MPRRVIIHAGFHKTGTTTVQRMLHANGPVLWPVMALGLRWKLKAALAAARAYSDWGDKASLDLFALRFGEFIGDLNLGKRRGIAVSSEELSGHMPGREGVADYGAAPQLAATMRQVVLQHYPLATISYYYSTRAADSWLESAWAEHVKSARMTLDRETFCARYAPAANFAPILARIREAVDPCDVIDRPLGETTMMPLGPAEPVIDMMGLAPERRILLKPQPRENTALPPDILLQCLELNQSNRNYNAVRAAKARLLERFTRKEAAE